MGFQGLTAKAPNEGLHVKVCVFWVHCAVPWGDHEGYYNNENTEIPSPKP